MIASVRISGEIQAGDLIIGMATFLLALATVLLGRQARSQVEVSRRSIEAADMPFVIPSGWRTSGLIGFEHGQSAVLALRLRLWNVGKGAAIVNEIRLMTYPEDSISHDLLDRLPAEIPVAAGGWIRPRTART